MQRGLLHAVGAVRRHQDACPCPVVYASLIGPGPETLRGSSQDLYLVLQP